MQTLSVVSLDQLAERIKAEHAQCEVTMRAGVEHALKAGELLIEAKALCGHGEWGNWLQTHCEFSERTAQGYMRLAREWPDLAESKAQHVADLSLRGALLMLSEPKPEPDELQKAQAWAAEFDAWWDMARAELGTFRTRLDDPTLDLPECVAIEQRAGVLQNQAAEFQLRASREAGRLLNWMELARSMGDVETMIGYAELIRDVRLNENA
jgi:Protein of unknown function (DUF3102)